MHLVSDPTHDLILYNIIGLATFMRGRGLSTLLFNGTGFTNFITFAKLNNKSWMCLTMMHVLNCIMIMCLCLSCMLLIEKKSSQNSYGNVLI